jgi:carbon monoxide dehydrogenase subunit G
MKLNGTFTFSGPRHVVWDLLQDPVVLARALPGTERLTLTSAGQYEGVMKVSVGPMTAAKFDVVVTMADTEAPERFTMHIDGKGPVGFTRGTATVELTDGAEGGTVIGLQPRDVAIAEADLAPGDRPLAGNGAQQRGLADAVAAEHAGHRAGPGLQRDAAQRLGGAVIQVETAHRQHAHRPR